MSYKIIAGHSLVPGVTKKDHIHVDGTELHVPHIMLCGKKGGPTLLVTAGIHNAEFVGIQAAIELADEIDTEQLSGSLIIIPLANRSGFENRTMSLVYEDGKNLNRVFPGDAEGSESDRLAHMLYNTFIIHADAYIDLHSGDGYEELTPFVYYLGDTPAEDTSRKMAECVSTDYCVRSCCRTGGAYNIASVNGIPSVLIERGSMSQYTKEEVEADKHDVMNIMRMLGMISGDHIRFPKPDLSEKGLTAPSTGCWYPALHAGDSFEAGAVLGEIRDYFGNIINRIIAPQNGIILHQCASLNILEGDTMIAFAVCPEDELQKEKDIAEIETRNARYWDRRASSYSDVNKWELGGESRDAWKSVIKTCVSAHYEDKDPAAVKVLDVGCGPGFFAVILTELGYNVTAADLSTEMLSEAKLNAGDLADRICFRQMNAEALDTAIDHFDVVISRNLTWNLPDPGTAYAEWCRVLKPGGLLINFDANWYHYLFDDDKRADYEADRIKSEDLGIDDQNVGEDFDIMEEIARSMPLSRIPRPSWDLKLLGSLGMKASADTEVWKRVWTDQEKVNFASTPMFMITAVK